MEEIDRIWENNTPWYLLLMRCLRRASDFEQTERLSVILLIDLAIENNGEIRWSLRELQENLCISTSVLRKTFLKLEPENNPFAAFVQVHKDINGQYSLFLKDWLHSQIGPDETQMVPIPLILGNIIPEVFEPPRSKVIWEERKPVSDGILQIKLIATPPPLQEDQPIVLQKT